MNTKIASTSNIVVLTGAGISEQSGIQTFRASDGLWENHPIEDVATPEGFVRDPQRVYDFYNQRLRHLRSPAVKPNAAHYALAELAKRNQVNLTLVTQNVDDLHERAGSTNVLHMHGSLLHQRCCNSHKVSQQKDYYATHIRCDCCSPAAPMRPDIVWFGEMPKYMEVIENALYSADLFVAVGTSGNVYPAAGLVDLANQFGVHTVELNLAPSAREKVFERGIYGPATDVVPTFFSNYLGL